MVLDGKIIGSKSKSSGCMCNLMNRKNNYYRVGKGGVVGFSLAVCASVEVTYSASSRR